MAPLRLADIHRAVGFFQRPARFGMRAENGNAGGGTRADGAAAVEREAEPVDGLFQRGRLGAGVGLAQFHNSNANSSPPSRPITSEERT